MAEQENRRPTEPLGGDTPADRTSEASARPRRRNRRRGSGRGAAERTNQHANGTAPANEKQSQAHIPGARRAPSGQRPTEPRPQQTVPGKAHPARQPKARPDHQQSTGQRRPATARPPERASTQGTGGQRRPGQARPAPRPRPAGSQPKEAAPAAAPAAPAAVAEPESNVLVLPDQITIRELAALMKRTPIDIIKELMKNGVMANINQQIDFDTAAIVADEMGFVVEHEAPPEPQEPEQVVEEVRRGGYTAEEYAALPPRPPVVTVMGHVDHGKTSLLDAIRQTNVVAGEVGGITQHIGAYQVETHGRLITFLDTPGHEAFTAMRARGARVTDIAVLVVAADDGVMPQTLEAINHARAAGVPIVVALNKIDKESANPDLVKQQLAEADLVAEEYGGNVIVVPVSAKQKIGIDTLLEMILLVADMADLRADPTRPARGTVIEGRLDRARGPMATLLVQDGTLRSGDNLVIGTIAGRVRAMFNERGERIEEAPPSTPAAVLGLPEVPEAGSTFEVVADEKTARAIASERALAQKAPAEQAPTRPMTLEEVYARAAEGQVKSLNLILKADVQGSIEPIETSLARLGDENLKVRLLLKGTGSITESDVSLAIASNAIVIGFNVPVDPAAARLADANGVDIRVYDIIYRLTEDIEKALKGLLEPVYRDVTIGHAQVRATFRIPKVGTIAGAMVTDGIAARNAFVRVLRGGNRIHDGKVASLKRFTEDVREVAAGYECGIGLEGFDAFETGDILEFYRKEQAS